MNNEEKSLIIRLDERVKNMHDDIKEIIDTTKGVKGCVNNNTKSMVRIDTTLKNHLSGHKRDLTIVGLVILLTSVIAGTLI